MKRLAIFTVVLAGCGDKAPHTSLPKHNHLEVIDSMEFGRTERIVLVRDKETKRQFVIASDVRGIDIEVIPND